MALALTLPDYHSRVMYVKKEIVEHAYKVKDNTITKAYIASDTVLQPPKNEKILVEYLLRHKNHGSESIDNVINKIEPRLFDIWLRYTTLISIMTILPFAMLGLKIAFRQKRKDINQTDRWQCVRHDWGMKFFAACAIATGWTYTLNPLGRAGSTLVEYLNTQDVFSDTTLPGFISIDHPPLVAVGFLGWYLHLISYFISKLYYDDVFGTRIYRFLMGKLLFTYGIAMVISTIDAEQGRITIFLIGYFPLSALTILKEFGVKVVQGGIQEKGTLSQLPSISRFQILRLNEEGIDNINMLASYPYIDELKKYQSSIAPLIDLWVDCAQLYSIVGDDCYLKIKSSCSTASEFLRLHKTPEFQSNLVELGIKNPEEIARLLKQTFNTNVLLTK